MAFPVEEKYIIAAEDELGIEFPECFRFKMIEENGGEIVTEEDDWQLFPFFDQSDLKRISRTCNHIVLENDNIRASDHFPTEGIAIASNGCGDFLLFLPSLQDRKILGSEIFLWTHENGIIEKIAETIEELNDN